jgi:hypothetical protein
LNQDPPPARSVTMLPAAFLSGIVVGPAEEIGVNVEVNLQVLLQYIE